MLMSKFSIMMHMHICLLFLYLLMPDIHVASLNVNGARDRLKRAEIYDIMTQKNIDVFFLQETHSDIVNAADWAKEFKGQIFLSHNTTNSGGVAICFSPSFTPVSYEVDDIVKGRLLKVKAQFENDWYVFMCIYAPTKGTDRMVFLDVLGNALRQCDPGDFLLAAGDFNCTEQNLDRNHIEPHMPSRRRLTELMSTYDLCDIWRNFHYDQKQYTWVHCHENSLSLARLDRLYSVRHYLNVYKSCSIIPIGFSDHSMVVATLSIKSVKPKSAFWHFNTTLLEDNNFKDIFSHFWFNFRSLKGNFSSLQQWWDIGKIKIKQLCQQYTFNVTRYRNMTQKTLENEIKELQILADSTNDEQYIEKMRIRKLELKDLLEKRAQGALIRSRFQNTSDMDVPSKNFFWTGAQKWAKAFYKCTEIRVWSPMHRAH